MIVMKFGGTSVADANALRSVLSIVHRVRDAGDRSVVVLSATSGTTDRLLALARSAGAGDALAVTTSVTALRDRHHQICSELISDTQHRIAATQRVDALVDALHRYCHGMTLLRECTARSLDEVASFGERLSTTIFHAACEDAGLNAEWLDARRVMRTDDTFQSALVDMSTVRELCSAQILTPLQQRDVIITQGFIGATPEMVTTTLGRGGSDTSAAILGAASGASEIRIYTDVSGILTTDPRLVDTARPIAELSFTEVRELASFGAKVLHPDTIRPAIDASIPVRVLNTFRPQDAGTTIVAHASSDSDLHAVSILRDCLLVTMRTLDGSDARTLMTDALQGADFDVILSGGTAEAAITVIRCANEQRRFDAEVALAHCTASLNDCTLLCVTGPAAASARSTERIAAAVSSFRIHGILAGTSSSATFILVDPEQAGDALRATHGVIV
jgi:aspartate kinase